MPRQRDSDMYSDAQGDNTGYNGYQDPYSQAYEGHDQVNVLQQHSAVPHQVRRESEGQWSEGDSEVLLLEQEKQRHQGWRQG